VPEEERARSAEREETLGREGERRKGERRGL